MSYGKGITYMNQKKSNIVLFDMDGTLTEARRFIEKPMIHTLRELFDQNERAHIGVVTGSDLDYVQQQMQPLIKQDYNLAREIHWLPCNGTKYYKLKGTSWQPLHVIDMENHLGEDKFSHLMRIIVEQQCHMAENRIPLTGHFVNYRGSMINWCPIGRNAKPVHRKIFENMDKNFSENMTLRGQYLKRLISLIRDDSIVCKLGGDTSFDIYPKGWDKTYCLKFFEGYNKFFVGDRCYASGNDHEIYNSLQPKAWQTHSPAQTIKIIKENIYPLLT